jgi:aminopeptidase
MEPKIAAANALKNVLDAVPNEKILIICDKEKADVGTAFAEGALENGLWTRQVTLDPGPASNKKNIRTQTPDFLHEIVTSSRPDIFINLLRGPAQETPFRIMLIALETRRRIRLGHCPGITLDMLTDGALALTDNEYKEMQDKASKLMQTLIGTKTAYITNDLGTDLRLSTASRPFFTDTKLNWQTMKWMNLPVGEVLCGPVEDSLEGTLICDLAVGGTGLLKEPVVIKAKRGKAVLVSSGDVSALKTIKQALSTDEWSDRIGEFAFGLNPKARLCDEFLETEKLCNTAHIAFGHNTDFPGGQNTSQNHMDFLISRPTIEVEKESGDRVIIMKKGKYLV